MFESVALSKSTTNGQTRAAANNFAQTPCNKLVTVDVCDALWGASFLSLEEVGVYADDAQAGRITMPT